MNDIGMVKSVTGTSMNLNTRPGQGCDKPVATKGSASPGGTKPPKPAEVAVSMPK